MIITKDAFKYLANQMLGKKQDRSEKEQKKDFAHFFGTCPVVCADLWNRLDPINKINTKAQPRHLLWSLLFLYKYYDEKSNCQIVGIKDPKEFRKWTWVFVKQIADLECDIVS